MIRNIFCLMVHPLHQCTANLQNANEPLCNQISNDPNGGMWFPAGDGGITVQGYFVKYFGWYNNDHYHSGIDYVTPEQKHTGQADVILQQRKKQLTAARKNRIDYWRSQPQLTDGGL